jgi:hypothetical protein
VVIVLTCTGALAVELGLVIATQNNPGGVDTTIARMGIVTSLICAGSGVAGVTRKPALAIPELGVALGLFGLVLFIGLEAVSRACFVCF